jgi:hypothetical protein
MNCVNCNDTAATAAAECDAITIDDGNEMKGIDDC